MHPARHRTRLVTLGSLLVASCLTCVAGQPQADSAGNQATLRVNVNALLIPVVVRDDHGQIVTGLAQSDFQVLDNGKSRAVTGFSVAHSARETESSTASNPPALTAAAAPSPRSLVLLIDDLHFSPSGLIQVQKAVPKVLDQVLGPNDRAVVLSFRGVNSGFTADRKVLAETIEKIKAQPTDLNDRSRCPDISYYVADQILNKHSNAQYQIELERAENCTHRSSATNPGYLDILVHEAANQALLAGDQDAMAAVGFLREVEHSMSRLPGQRTLVLISPGFLNFSEEAMRIESQVLNDAARDNIVINALDLRGLTTGNMSANESGAGSFFAQITGATPSNFSEASGDNDDMLAELAGGTGGYFLRGGNDISQQFIRAAAAPETVYLLEVSLQGIKQDGKYHRIQVKVKQDRVKVQARRGYYAPSSTQGKK